MQIKGLSESAIIATHMRTAGSDIFRLIEELGITFVKDETLGEVSGKIEFDGENYVISVNASESINRQRFTAAHEVGHYVLHRDLLRKAGKLHRHTDILFSGSKNNPAAPFSEEHEVQANKYAARLLMPAGLIRSEFERLDGDLGAMASRFKVSAQAMKIMTDKLTTSGIAHAKS